MLSSLSTHTHTHIKLNMPSWQLRNALTAKHQGTDRIAINMALTPSHEQETQNTHRSNAALLLSTKSAEPDSSLDILIFVIPAEHTQLIAFAVPQHLFHVQTENSLLPNPTPIKKKEFLGGVSMIHQTLTLFSMCWLFRCFHDPPI